MDFIHHLDESLAEFPEKQEMDFIRHLDES
jgi:hypothetical protein